ncbi:thiolase family protein, partial [Staphylococcus aureus]|uniref:thiolase family protein n=1 Tax=Staphylococcus aureus TaxID=1280 RepID=UPI0030F39BA6
SSGLQTIAHAANQIIADQADVLVAGGIELMSAVPMGGNEPTNNPILQDEDSGVSYPMGLTAEMVAETYNVSREDQDAYAVQSHQRAAEAQQSGKFEDEIIPIEVNKVTYDQNGPVISKEVFKDDELIRPDTNKEALAKLKVKELGVKPIARFVGFKAVGVDPKLMGIGPAYAIPEVLKQADLDVSDIDLVELNEAFASQTLASMREVGLDTEKTNVNGGAIALGHPLGATGAMLVGRLLSEMKKRPDTKYGMVTMCIGVGMGAAGIFEYIR